MQYFPILQTFKHPHPKTLEISSKNPQKSIEPSNQNN